MSFSAAEVGVTVSDKTNVAMVHKEADLSFKIESSPNGFWD
jgi:hypothetical protein